MIHYPYFTIRVGDDVASVFVVHPELLARDDPQQRGKPFLFYIGDRQPHLRGWEIEEGGCTDVRPYVGRRQELADLLKGRVEPLYAYPLGVRPYGEEFTKLPEYVTINGEPVLTETFVRDFGQFSFRAQVENDCQQFRETKGGTVRLDLTEFKDVLRKFEKEKGYDYTLGYRVQHFLKKE